MVITINMPDEDFIRWRNDLVAEGLVPFEINSEGIFKGVLENNMFTGKCDISTVCPED